MSGHSAVGIVTALKLEAGPLTRHPELAVRVCGVAGSGIGEAVRALRDGGSRLVVSWGTAGALWPRLRAGDLILPDRIVCRDGGIVATDAGARDGVRAFLGDARRVASGTMLESSRLLATPTDKRGPGRDVNAIAVDMESGRIGQACIALNLPFLVVRVVVDETGDRLPRPIHDCTTPDGALRTGALLAALTRHPGEWAALFRLARRYRRARRTLETAARALAGYAGSITRIADHPDAS